MHNIREDENIGEDGSPAAAASRLMCNVYPSRLVGRDGDVVGCWMAVGALPLPSMGETTAQVRIVGVLRTVDGRVVGSDELYARDAGLGMAVLRDLALATRDLGQEHHGNVAARFVSGLRTIVRHAAMPGDEVPFSAAMSRVIEDALGWRPTDTELATACRGWRRSNATKLRRFLRTLDVEALRTALPLRGMDDLVGSAWPGLDNTFEAGAPLGAAIRARPHQARLLLQTWTDDPDRVRDAVNNGNVDGLVDELVVETGLLPPSLLPALVAAERATDRASTDRSGPIDPVGLTRRLIGLPVRTRPGTEAEWDALREVCPVLDEIRTWRGPRQMTSALLGFNRSWQRIHRLLADAAGTGDMELALSRLATMSRHLAREVLLPAVARADGRSPDHDAEASRAWTDAAHTLLTGGLSMRAILGNAADWEVARNLRTSRDPSVAGMSWPACLPDGRYHRVRLRVLANGAEVVAAVSNPAVLGVVPGRLLSEAVIGSKRTRFRLLSIEVGSDATGWSPESIAAVDLLEAPPRVLAHVGVDGAKPGQDSVNALSRYMRELRRGVLSVDLTGVAPAAAAKEPTLASLCGYEWRDNGAWKAARRSWDRFLPSVLQGADSATMATAVLKQLAVGGKRWSPTSTQKVIECEHPSTRM